MKAVRFHQHGGVEVLHYEDVPEPNPGPGDVVVRVRSCALNHLDIFQRCGLPGVMLPHISGSDVAGEIAHSTVSDVSEGQRVMLQPGLSCGHCRHCLSGQDNLCREYDLLGYRCDGGYAELVKAPAQNVIKIPETVGFVEAAAFPLTFLTAWHMLVTRAVLKPDETVLVLAAGSGVGQAAIQVARWLGARVIATAGSARKLELALEHGAHEVIDHYKQDIAQEVKKLTDKRGVDVVCEHVGQATWTTAMRCLVRGGRLVTCGATSGPEVTVDLRHLFARQLSLIGSYMGSKGELDRAASLFFAARLSPVIDRIFPLSEAAAAQTRMENKEHFGKIVLEP